MSSLSWDVPPSPTNPSAEDGDDLGNGHDHLGHDEDSLLEMLEREQRDEREQLEQLEREQLELLGQIDQIDHLELEQLEGEQLEQMEREQLEVIEREQLQAMEPRQAEPIDRPDPPRARHQPQPPRPEPGDVDDSAETAESAAAAADERRRLDAQARAEQFLAATTRRRERDDQAGPLQPVARATGRRVLDEPARAARAIVEHRHQNLVEANALLTDARRVLAPIAYRGLSDRIYRRRKIIFAVGEAVSLSVAFSAAFDVAPLEALLLSGAIALAFVVAGDLGGVLRISAERSRLSSALEDDAVRLDPRYLHLLYQGRQPWLTAVGGATAGLFAVAAVSVGVLRAANGDSFGLAAGLGLLTVSLAIAAGLSSWQHASIGSEIIDHLQREEEAAARRLKRAAAARVLRRPAVRGEEPVVQWQAPDGAWDAPELPSQAPDVRWEAPARDRRPRPARREPREKRGKRERREDSSGRVGMAAARGALLLARVPGLFRRGEREERREEASEEGSGPGAAGDSAGPITNVTFTPPITIKRPFP